MELNRIYVFCVLTFQFHIIVSTVPAVKEYCNLEAFSATCEDNEVISMASASYGLMRKGRCITTDFGHLGCFSDQLQYMDHLCSGRQSCELSISNYQEMQGQTNCPPEFTPYLEASYTCQKVLDLDRSLCLTPLAIKSGSVVISSLSAKASECATQNSPLIIESDPGQKINITLVDYNWREGLFDGQRKTCEQLYGHIVSYDSSDILEICGGLTRIQHVHTASSHIIQIAFDEAALQRYTFLLRVQVFGCRDIVPPPNSWLRKEGDRVVIGCHSGPDTWEMKCIGNHWIGPTGNCTERVTEALTEKVKTEEFNESHVLAIGIGCLAFVFCCVTITIGVYFIKRYKTKVSLESTYGKLNKTEQLHNLTLGPAHTGSQFATLVARGSSSDGTRGQTLRSANLTMIRGSHVPVNVVDTLPGQHDTRGLQQTLPHNRTEQMAEAQYENTQYRGNDRESVMYYVLENPPGYNDTQTPRN